MQIAGQGFVGGAPQSRLRSANGRAVDPDGSYVLYWMIAARRADSNFALDRAVAWARQLARPVVVVEDLRLGYPYASDRLHRFAIDGMADNARSFGRSEVLYHPYVEPSAGASRGFLERLSRDAAVVVTDDVPGAFIQRTISAESARAAVLVEAVDSNGLIPLSTVPRVYPAAVHFRRFMQSVLHRELLAVPAASPLRIGVPRRLASLPEDVVTRWPAATVELLEGGRTAMSALPVDHDVPVVSMKGGPRTAERVLSSFVRRKLATYDHGHMHPDDAGSSRLSPYLHFGHISAHRVFERVMRQERWTIGRLAKKPTGKREGWWGVGRGAEAFLDQLVVWRELGFNTSMKRPQDHARFEGLPDWARDTLEAHASDPRPYVYSRRAFERAETHDQLWNAAQRQLLRDGWMHNAMRMLWGKKILEWSASPRRALETMMALMDRWSLDGQDPNSYAGYMWTLGLYDRPWPERPIYGRVRSMSSERSARKLRVKRYLATYADQPAREGR